MLKGKLCKDQLLMLFAQLGLKGGEGCNRIARKMIQFAGLINCMW